MNISTVKDFGQIDYPGKLAAVVLSSGCNYRCPACHSPELIKSESRVKEDDFFTYLESQKRWLDGVVLCGGEPTRQIGLIPFARKIKELGYSIKLDTNGSSHAVLQDLLEKKLVDYVAMDVKGPPELYNKIAGAHIDLRDNVMKAISIVSRFPNYEYRTTVVPVIRDEEGKDISFMTSQEVGETAKFICENAPSTLHKYYIQKFVSRKNGLLDSRLESFPETPINLLEDCLKEARKYLSNAKMRA